MKTTKISITLGAMILLSLAACKKNEITGEYAAEQSADMAVATTDSISNVASMTVKDKQFIKTANVDMEVKDVYNATIAIENSAKKLEGFVTHSNLKSQIISEEKFNTSDSAGVLFCKKLNIPVGIITGEDTAIVKRRADKLNISILYQGINDKLTVAKSICESLNISLKDVAYIGDDIGDLELLQNVGISAAQNNAPSYIKNKVSFVTKKNGGEGAFREFVETILGEDIVLSIVC